MSVLDVTYDSTLDAWLCCNADDDGNITCDNPTSETVSAKQIASIATTYVVPSVVATTSATGDAAWTTSTEESADISVTTEMVTSTGASPILLTGSGPTSAASATSAASTASTASAASIASAATNTSQSKASSGGSSHSGAIAGGVVGGVAFVALVAGGLWFWYRRRRTAGGYTEREVDRQVVRERFLDEPVEKPADIKLAELSTRHNTPELYGAPIGSGKRTNTVAELP